MTIASSAETGPGSELIEDVTVQEDRLFRQIHRLETSEPDPLAPIGEVVIYADFAKKVLEEARDIAEKHKLKETNRT